MSVEGKSDWNRINDRIYKPALLLAYIPAFALQSEFREKSKVMIYNLGQIPVF
jgi:hypothetical protein